MNDSAFRRLTAPLRRRIKVMFTRALGNLVDPATLMQTLQVEALAGETLDGVEHFEPYGFTSNPQPGFEALLAALGGDRAHTVCVVAADRRFRLKNLAPGEVALYTDEGDVIHFRRNRIIEINGGEQVTVNTKVAEINATISATVTSPVVNVNASTSADVTSPLVNVVASTKVTFSTPLAEVSGNLTVGGAINATGLIASAVSVADPNGTMQEMRGYYNAHGGHSFTGGGPASPQMS